jgi:hypothetical protein
VVRRSSDPFCAWIVALIGGFACSEPDAAGPRVASAVAPLPLREASAFVCEADLCLQRHPRLPDTGEWRCAEREGVVWCAGGEPAAGVVALPKARGYTCGERRKSERGRRERICVDAAPDYPSGRKGEFSCRFTERGARECGRKPTRLRALAGAPEPNCWLDADCEGARCDRGTCAAGAP